MRLNRSSVLLALLFTLHCDPEEPRHLEQCPATEGMLGTLTSQDLPVAGDPQR